MLFGEIFMRKAFISKFACLVMCVAVIMCSVFSVTALDDSYRIDELGMTLKIPKEYTVITRSTDKADPAFSRLSLDYDETMTAFYLDHVYLQAVSDDNGLKINLRQVTDENSKKINNYSDLNEAQRKQALNTFLENDMCESGVEIKHNDNIFFDLNVTQQSQSGVLYIYQCHTVINGMNIDLTLEKSKEALTADEIKVVTNIANSMEFDEIHLLNGPAFDWWRFLLWIVVLVVVAVVANYFYRRYNQNRKSNVKNRRIHNYADSESDELPQSIAQQNGVSTSKKSLLSELGFDDDNNEATFDELLGYDKTDYHSRSNSQIEDFDIKVKGKNSKAVSYFEEDTRHSSKNEDYFDAFFNDKDEVSRGKSDSPEGFISKLKSVFTHTRYFCINVWRLIFPSKKSKRKRRKK